MRIVKSAKTLLPSYAKRPQRDLVWTTRQNCLTNSCLENGRTFSPFPATDCCGEVGMTPTEYGAAREHEKPQDRIAREAKALERRWILESRWKGVKRDYRAADVLRLRGSFRVEHTIARLGAE